MAGSANICFGKVGIGGSPGLDSTVFYPEQYETLATSESAATSSVNSANTTGNQFRNAVRVMLSELGYVAIGAAATTASMKCQPDVEYYFAVKAGQGVSIIDAA